MPRFHFAFLFFKWCKRVLCDVIFVRTLLDIAYCNVSSINIATTTLYIVMRYVYTQNTLIIIDKNERFDDFYTSRSIIFYYRTAVERSNLICSVFMKM